jgi:hypothetical protein
MIASASAAAAAAAAVDPGDGTFGTVVKAGICMLLDIFRCQPFREAAGRRTAHRLHLDTPLATTTPVCTQSYLVCAKSCWILRYRRGASPNSCATLDCRLIRKKCGRRRVVSEGSYRRVIITWCVGSIQISPLYVPSWPIVHSRQGSLIPVSPTAVSNKLPQVPCSSYFIC